jgi:nicotinamide mononucleotide transporter
MEFSFLELAGFIFGVAGVWLTIRENIWCFPVGLVNVIISLVLFYQQKLYSDSVQQFVYIILLSYGWYNWLSGRSIKKLKVTRTGSTMLLAIMALAAMLSFTMGWVFSSYTDASFPYIDAAATSLSFAAQFMIARKKIENWYLWMIVNITYITIYINKDLYLYAVLFSVYLLLAVAGLRRWKRELQEQ